MNPLGEADCADSWCSSNWKAANPTKRWSTPRRALPQSLAWTVHSIAGPKPALCWGSTLAAVGSGDAARGLDRAKTTFVELAMPYDMAFSRLLWRG